MIALAGIGGLFHFPQQVVHFRQVEAAPCPYGTVAGHSGDDMVQFFRQSEIAAPFRYLFGQIMNQLLCVAVFD